MRSYLSLTPISAKVHRRQNRMTLLCIIFAVFLVTAIFSMADMGVRMEKQALLNKHGNYSMQLNQVSEDAAKQIGAKSDVEIMSWYDAINHNRDEEYYIGDKKAVLVGTDKTYITDIQNCLKEGSFPKSAEEIMLSPNAKTILGIDIGDHITIKTPAGSKEYTITGFGEDDAGFNSLYDTISAYMNQEAFLEICKEEGHTSAPVYYVRLNEKMDVNKFAADIKEEYGLTDERVSVNTVSLSLADFGSNSIVQTMYTAAAVLFVLILIAGVLMISSSMNSNVAQRTKFFGMMRCIGMSREQIIRFVRLEALNWCKTAIPIGVALV